MTVMTKKITTTSIMELYSNMTTILLNISVIIHCTVRNHTITVVSLNIRYSDFVNEQLFLLKAEKPLPKIRF